MRWFERLRGEAPRRKPTLCVDFDGVLHLYSSPWAGPGKIADGPVPGAMEWLLEMLEHYDVCIYSSRSKSLIGRFAMKRWLTRELARLYFSPALEQVRLGFEWDADDTLLDAEQHATLWAMGQVERLRFPLTKPAAFLTIDDRALTFTGNFADFGPRELKLFKPWNKRGDHADTGRGTGGGRTGTDGPKGDGWNVVSGRR